MGILHSSRAFVGPMRATLHLTNRCNIQCIHCVHRSPYMERPILRRTKRIALDFLDEEVLRERKNWMRLEVDTDRTLALIDELLAIGTRRLCFSGGGEPFFHMNALEFMARAKHGGATCMAFTGGHTLDREKVDALIEMEFDDLRVTTMAGTHEGYLRTHPGSTETTFDRLVDSLFHLAERKKALELQRPRIVLRCVVIPQNFDGLMDFAKFANDVRAEEVEYDPFNDFGDAGLSRLSLSKEEASVASEELLKVRAYLESKGIKHNLSNFHKVFRVQIDTMAYYNVIPCYYGWLSLLIDAEGMVYPCSSAYVPVGNINEAPFHQIWENHIYRRFRKEAVTINKRRTPVSFSECNNCCHYSENLAVHNKLHPIRGRSVRLEHDGPRR
jgi:radical SAM protein with 4Fe4S-binding SPASM domain